MQYLVVCFDNLSMAGSYFTQHTELLQQLDSQLQYLWIAYPDKLHARPAGIPQGGSAVGQDERLQGYKGKKVKEESVWVAVHPTSFEKTGEIFHSRISTVCTFCIPDYRGDVGYRFQTN